MQSRHRALVVDDDKAVCREIAETLRSVGHDCICVGTQEEAEAALGTQEFCYVLLDLQLPVSLKSIRPRLEIGFSLLAKIRERSQARDLWVVVMTAYGSEHFECLRAMKMGANDYLKKPFPESGSESLEAKVREAARACNRAHGQPPLERTAATPKLGRAEARSREPQPFVGGEMVFYLNRVELCGVRILGDSGLGHSRRMLDLLRQRRNDGRYVRMGGEDIAARIGAETGAAITIGTVTGCARTLRANFTERLRQHLNIMCDDQDVLAHDDQGYHLNDDKVVVRDGTDGGDNNNVPSNVPGDKADVPDVPGDTSLNERQTWIVAQIDKRAEVRRRAVEEKFGVSAKTAKRDFSELVKRGMVEYVSRPQPGFYRRR